MERKATELEGNLLDLEDDSLDLEEPFDLEGTLVEENDSFVDSPDLVRDPDFGFGLDLDLDLDLVPEAGTEGLAPEGSATEEGVSVDDLLVESQNREAPQASVVDEDVEVLLRYGYSDAAIHLMNEAEYKRAAYLEELKKRIKSIQDPNTVERVLNEYRKALKETERRLSLFGPKKKVPMGSSRDRGLVNDKPLYAFLSQKVRESLNAGEPIDENKLFEAVMNTNLVNRILYLEHGEHGVREYISAHVPRIVDDYKKLMHVDLKIAEERHRLAKVLLTDCDKVLRDLEDNRDNVHLIDFVQFDEVNSVVKCPVCGSAIDVSKGIFEILLYKTDRLYATALPIPNRCSCGACVIPYYGDAYSVQYYYMEGAHESVERFYGTVSKLSPTFSMAKIVPAHSDLMGMINWAYREGAMLDEMPTDMEEEYYVPSVTDGAFLEEVKQFYRHLRGLKEIELNEQNQDLDVKTIVQIVASILHLDLDAVKNNAVYSILYYFQSMPAVNAYIDNKDLWEYENALAALSALDGKDVGELDIDSYSVCEDTILRFATKEEAREFGKKSSSETDRSKMFQLVRKYKPVLEERVRTIRERRKIVIDSIKRSIDSLSFIKIIKVSSFSLSSYNRMMDIELASVVDQISDRMIVANYAGEFYKVWKGYNNTYATYANKCCSEYFNEEFVMVDTLRRRLAKVSGIQSSTMSANFRRTFKTLSLGSTRITDPFRRLDMPSFIREALALDVKGFPLSKQEIGELEAMKAWAKRQHCGEDSFSFYLSDFSKEELEDIQFELKLVKFGRYVPLRKEGESPKDYIERIGDSLSFTEVRDLVDSFAPVLGYTGAILGTSLLESIGYSDYINSVYTFEMLMAMTTKKNLCEVFGISEQLLSTSQIQPIRSATSHALAESVYKILHYNWVPSMQKFIDPLKEEFAARSLSSCSEAREATEEFAAQLKELFSSGEEEMDNKTQSEDYAKVITELEQCIGKTDSFWFRGVSGGDSGDYFSL